MRIYIFFSFITLISLSLSAKEKEGVAYFAGEGQVEAAPDYLTVGFTVKSECYPNPLEAQSSTDEVVEKIYNYAKAFKKDEDKYFKILVDGGYTSPYSRWHKRKEICRSTFQKSTNITLKISNSENFDKIFSQMQAYVLEQFRRPYMGFEAENPRTYVSISRPIPKISREHKKELERKAINLAMLDAKARFKSAIKSCRPHQWKILSIRERGASHRPRHYAAKFALAESAVQAPVIFDDLKVIKMLDVEFQIEGAMCFDD